MKRIQIATITAVCFVLSTYQAGCGNKFFDPTQIGRFRPVPAVNVILDSLGVAEETPSVWEGAKEPQPSDLTVLETDYRFNPGDIVRISIFELLQEGAAHINDYFVTETGKISIPEVGVVKAAGLTESQLEEEIRQILSPSILKEPSVTAASISSQQRTFSILGNGVPAPGRYAIPRYDFRLTDALATAGGWAQFNVSYIYVSRSIAREKAKPASIEPAISEPEEQFEPELEMLEIIKPRSQRQWPENKVVVASAETIMDKELSEAALPEGFEPLAVTEQGSRNPKQGVWGTFAELADQETTGRGINRDEVGRIEWIFEDGKWVPVRIGPPELEKPAFGIEPLEPLEEVPEGFRLEGIEAGVQGRVIRIPAAKFGGGDPRYNIVIRPGDSIHVPVDIIGEFCIMGNVNRQGYLNLTGRPMTLKMAIAAAGGLGPLAWPKRCEVTRRLGEDKEEIVMVDLDKIASGEQPDFFIKPNDLINVGTHPTSQWRRMLRNAFYSSYGFGFSYSRNFAYDKDRVGYGGLF